MLDALLRAASRRPYTCRKGTCGTCLLKHTGGAAPSPQSQASLRPTLREQGYFLACQCVPSGDMELALPESAALWTTTVVSKDDMAPGVVRLRLAVPAGFTYRAGQYVSLRRDDGLSRNYSLASLPGDPWLELHIRRHEQGRASRWISDELAAAATRSRFEARWETVFTCLAARQHPCSSSARERVSRRSWASRGMR